MAHGPGESELRIAFVHYQAGRVAEASQACRRISPEHREYVDALVLLAVMAGKTGRSAEGIQLLEEAVGVSPGRADLWHQLGLLQRNSGAYQSAIKSLQHAVKWKPADAQIQLALANTFQLTGNYDRSIACYQRAMELAPDLADALSNLGSVYRKIGRLDDAIACYRRTLELKPGSVITHDNLLLALLYHPDSTAVSMFEEYARWNRMHAEPVAKTVRFEPELGDADRRLRIGYLSPDFGDHPVGRFMLPLLREHDRSRFEIFCYSQNRAPDRTTAELQSHSDGWREIFSMSDAQVAEQIHQDRIDVLINLALHTAKNRLLVMARKPAPVQAVYLGYAGGCGVKCIDYRLTDKHIDPDETLDGYCFQKQQQLNGSYWCYPEPQSLEQAGPLPALGAGALVTLGCLNNFSKITVACLELWGCLLKRMPDARLMLHAPLGSGRDAVARKLLEAGVENNRVEFVDRLDFDGYLKAYHRIDIALDTMPFAGGTTTCDALWMGVPVVTLAGQTPVGRAGVSILTNAGFPGWIAQSSQEYISIVESLASDLPALAAIRSGLRKRLKNAPLMDAVGYARSFEVSLLQMWQVWCASDSDVGHK